MQITESVFFQELKKHNSDFIPGILDAISKATSQLSNRVPNIFPEYTLHNIDHSLRVMNYAADIIGDISRLNELEIAIFIYSSMLHDIGMALGEDHINLIKSGKLDTEAMVFSAMVKYYSDEKKALQEFIRRNHALMSSQIILKDFQAVMKLPDIETSNFASDVAEVCKYHTRGIHSLSNLPENNQKGRYPYNTKFIAHILRIADLLDIDGRRTPLSLYELIRPNPESDEEWRQHFVISNTNKISISAETSQKTIVFYGTCDDPHIHRKLYKYFSWIDDELYAALTSISKMSKKYWLNLKDRVEIQIKPKDYFFSNYFLRIDFKAITTLLMGEHIYGNKSFGLRELIQNSIDACKLKQSLLLKKYSIGDDEYKPIVKLIIDKANNKVIIKDNGIGMSEDVIKNYFLNIGKSYYTSTDFAFQDSDYMPIGNFGIGFLSCFMLSKNVTIKTRSMHDSIRFDIDLEQGTEYICLTQDKDPAFLGTEVVMDYSEFMNNMGMNVDQIFEFIDTFFVFDTVLFQFIIKDTKTIRDISTPLKSKIKAISSADVILDISKYLVDIEAHVLIKRRDNFISKIEDILDETLEFYDGNSIISIDPDDVCLKDAFNNNKFCILQIPIFNNYDKDDFEKALEYLDDIDAAMEKFDTGETIELLASKDSQNALYSGNTKMNDDFLITETHTLGEAISESSIKGFCPKVERVEINAIASDDYNLFLIYNNRHRRVLTFNLPHYYVRSVLLRDMHYDEDLPAVALFDVIQIWVNILNKNIIPNISRNNLDEKQSNELNYAIVKAIHLALRDSIWYNDIQKSLIAKFINIFYHDSNYLLAI